MSQISTTGEGDDQPMQILAIRSPAGFVTVFSLAILISSSGCSGFSTGAPPNVPRPQPNVVSLDPQDWYILYSSGTAAHPSPNAGVWSVSFSTTGHVNYIQTPFNATTVPHSVSLTFRVDSDSAQYEVIDPSDIPPATVHIFFEQKNDDLIDPDGRWWADPSQYNLGSNDNQTITTVVLFEPSLWSNVNGLKDAQSFYTALSNVGWIGMTCGGQYFWGHGVALDSGTASYILVDFNVQ
jgi:hypothetical protein